MARFDPKALARVLPALLDRAVASQTPLAAGYVRRVRARRTSARPAEVLARLERDYLAAVTAAGTAAGAAAAAPAVGAVAAFGINLAEVGWFVDATVLYAMGVAHVYGVHIADPERRRTLLLAIVTGNGLSGGVGKAAGRVGPHLARQIVDSIPMYSIRALNGVLGRNFVTKYGTKQGVLVLGRELPLGIGATIGAAGNAGIGYATVRAARRIFGPPPDDWPPPEPARPQPEPPPTGTPGTIQFEESDAPTGRAAGIHADAV